MINKKNYFEHIERIGFENLPLPLKQFHTVIMAKTDNGKDWTRFAKDKEFQKVIKLAFQKLSEFIKFRAEQNLSGTKPNKENGYSTISKEVSFIHRMLQLNDQILYKKTLEIFIRDLQTAIKDKKIRKASPVAKDITQMQQSIISIYNSMKSAKHFVLKPETVKRYKAIIEKYENALAEEDGGHDTQKATQVPLSGVPQTKQQIMCSTEFANMKFDTIGFDGKWLKLIGDPCKGFTAMVFGKPKMGKSYLCVDFAGYLARKHGKVLYVAKEEKLDATLQKKLNDKEVVHENLFVSDSLPADLSSYDYIFLDSVTKLGLSPEDIDKLRAANPGKTFIFIFQSTKEGNFRGDNAYQHDVDVVIEVPERGRAVQFGRFNQGGEIAIFDQDAQESNNTEAAPENLDGIKKKGKPDWTEPEWLNPGDHWTLKQIKKHYENGDFEMAMNTATNADTVIREAIPGEIWKKIGGKLTPTGEERLRKEAKTASKPKRVYLAYTFEVVELERIYNAQMGKDVPDIGFYEILADAVQANPELPDQIKDLGKSLNKILPQLYKASKKYQQN